MSSIVYKLSAILLSLVTSVIFIALVLQVCYTPPRVYSGWRSFAATVELNELGFRGQSIHYDDADTVVVLLGDSLVENLTGCSLTEMPEKRLQHHLRQTRGTEKLKVFSLGAAGYGQDQELLALQEYYKSYRADLVLLWLTPGNDVWNNMFPTHWPRNGTPKPTFYLENGQLQGPSELHGQEICDHPLTVIRMLKMLMLDRDKAWERYLPRPYQPVTDFQGDFSTEWQERWDNNIGSMQCEDFETEKCHQSITFYPPSERLLYGLEVTKSLLHEIERTALINQSTFLIFFVERIIRESDIHLGIAASSGNVSEMPREIVYSLNGKFYTTSAQQFIANVRYLIADFHSLEVPVTIDDWRVSHEDGHLNRFAVDQVMRDLARQLVDFRIIQEKLL